MIWITSELGTEQQCLDMAERLRWPRGARCVECNSPRVFKFVANETARRLKRADGGVEEEEVAVPVRHLNECLECGRQFSISTGTAFDGTHVPLTKWFFAIALMLNSHGSVTARQMQRDMRVSYQTAWYLRHRIKAAIDL